MQDKLPILYRTTQRFLIVFLFDKSDLVRKKKLTRVSVLRPHLKNHFPQIHQDGNF